MFYVMKISVVGCKVVIWSSLVGGYNMSSGIWLLPSSWKSLFWLHVDSLCALLELVVVTGLSETSLTNYQDTRRQ